MRKNTVNEGLTRPLALLGILQMPLNARNVRRLEDLEQEERNGFPT
jgi:hypothetical protein